MFPIQLPNTFSHRDSHDKPLLLILNAKGGVAEGHRCPCPRARWISAMPSLYRCVSDFGALSRLAPERAIPERGVGGWGAARLRAPLSGERLTAGLEGSASSCPASPFRHSRV